MTTIPGALATNPRRAIARARLLRLLPWLLGGLAVAVFLKNAWVGDDAYVSFRSLEQLFAGRGPRWNPHERVQVFTSPLWFWGLALFRGLSADVYLNSLLASLLSLLGLLALVRRSLVGHVRFAVVVLLLLGSNAFFDYTSSGLESPLAYLLLATFLVGYGRVFDGSASDSRRGPSGGALPAFAALGGLLVCRHDLATLAGPPACFLAWRLRHEPRPRIWAWVLLSLGPLLTWSLVSLAYYGFAFPNTAYAKLSSGLPRLLLVQQGLEYLAASFRGDLLTVIVLAVGLLRLALAPQGHLRALALGLAGNVAYVVWIGGDFMRGRFLASAYLVAVIALARWGWPAEARAETFGSAGRATAARWSMPLLLAALALYATFYRHTPLNSGWRYADLRITEGIADERGFYFRENSLWQYVRHRLGEETVPGVQGIFPAHRFARIGRRFGRGSRRMGEFDTVGMTGYFAGVDKIVLDRCALGDPLLARLPPRAGATRVGHLIRDLPPGYPESIASGRAELEDAELNEFYRRLLILTSAPRLFSRERFLTIARMNLGAYDVHLRRAWERQTP